MKILITTDWYAPVINGVVTSVLNLKEALEKEGHEVRVATMSERGWAYREGEVYYLRSVDAGRIYPGARAICLPGCGFLKELKEWGPDIIHSQCEFSSFLVAKKLAGALQIPIVHTYHTVYEDYTHYFCSVKPWGRQAAAVFSRFILERTDRVIVPTAKVERLLTEYGVDRPISVIPTGIRTERYMPSDLAAVREERERIREGAGIKKDAKVMMTLGRLAKEKRVEELIAFFGRLSREDIELLIVGDGPCRKELEALAARTEGGRRIHFAGMAAPEETPAYYHAADWFVCASQSETQGITYLEALASGLPVLCRKDPCVDGIVRDGENGFQYEDGREFESCCLRLAEDEVGRNLMSALAVRTGSDHDAAHFGRSVLEVYEQALAERAPAAAG